MVIVVSGVSGRFPQSRNVEEFYAKLLNGEDLVSDASLRWNPDRYDIPKRMGLLPDIDKFDARFFGMHTKQAKFLDSRLRLLLELTQEAIIDAGINPTRLRGSNTGVFVGLSGTETFGVHLSNCANPVGQAFNGYTTSMVANRVSFAFDLRGPSLAIDTACSSGLLAFQRAFESIKNGECDGAIVAGANVMVDPKITTTMNDLGLLSSNGACKVFDAAADGYVRSEAVVAVYLCRPENARRVYATVLGTASNTDGFKKEGINYPGKSSQLSLYEQIYSRYSIPPQDVAYIEAHGTGTPVGDAVEVSAIAEFFCQDNRRAQGLLIGSVKSNMGHSEPTAGLCSLVKLIMSKCYGTLPKNLNYATPSPTIPALQDGRVKVVSENVLWPGDIVAVNSFGYGGSNVHVVLSFAGYDGIPHSIIPPDVPVLVPISSRTKEGLEQSLSRISVTELHQGVVALMHSVEEEVVERFEFRGYALVGAGSGSSSSNVSQAGGAARTTPPVYFVFPGMGSQWSDMGSALLELPPFLKSIKMADHTLSQENLSVLRLLGNKDDNIRRVCFEPLLITCIQVALVDLLRSLGVHGDGWLGHSLGEIACAYADGCLTHGEAILVAYHRAIAIHERCSPNGAMISVGLTLEGGQKRCVNSIAVACHNLDDNVTLSGPAEEIAEISASLKAEDVFVREVNSNGLAFHTRSMEPAAHRLGQRLETVITNPKPRSSKWISTSCSVTGGVVLEGSPQYFVNNLVSMVRFKEALDKVPQDALVLEIGPHSTLLPLLKRRFEPNGIVVLGLTNKRSQNQLGYTLDSLGKLYNAGLNLNLGEIYEAPFPLGPTTPPLSPFVQWDHQTSWYNPRVQQEEDRHGGLMFMISLQDSEYSFLRNHVIDGKIILPATGQLWLVWKALSQLTGKKINDLEVIFEHVSFENAVIIPENDSVQLCVQILQHSGSFLVSDSHKLVICHGYVRVPNAFSEELLLDDPIIDKCDANEQLVGDRALSSDDLYRLAEIQGFDFRGPFRSIISVAVEAGVGRVKWENNWVTLLDSLLQVMGHFSAQTHTARFIPARIEKICVNPTTFHSAVQQGSQASSGHYWTNIQTDLALRVVRCPGVEILNPLLLAGNVMIDDAGLRYAEEKFAPFHPSSFGQTESLADAIQFCFEVTLSTAWRSFDIVELSRTAQDALSQNFPANYKFSVLPTHSLTVFAEKKDGIEPGSNDTARVNMTIKEFNAFKLLNPKADLLVLTTEMLPAISKSSLHNYYEFVILVGNDRSFEPKINQMMRLISSRLTHDQSHVRLYRRKRDAKTPSPTRAVAAVRVSRHDFTWLSRLQELIQKIRSEDDTRPSRIILYSDADPSSGIMGLGASLLREADPGTIQCFFNLDNKNNASGWNFERPSLDLRRQMEKDLPFNVWKNNEWGMYTSWVIPPQDLSQPRETQDARAFTNRTNRASVTWIEQPAGCARREGKHLAEIHYTGLNFKDVLLLSGQIVRAYNVANLEIPLGYEWSGKMSGTGERVFGIKEEGGALATSVFVDDNHTTWSVPKSWKLEEAATVPINYYTALAALRIKGRLRGGETVLIHSGAGGVGIAAITVALRLGCTVYTTVSTEEKKRFLQQRFPQLRDNHFSHSRRPSAFKSHILKETRGRGVDLVLNSLAGEGLMASLRCVRRNGRFIEIGKYDLLKNSALSMGSLVESISFSVLDLGMMAEDRSGWNELSQLFSQSLIDGTIQPLPLTLFSHSDIQRAFQYLSSGNHIGKVVIRIREENECHRIQARPHTYFSKSKVYLVVGGLGGMALEMLKWMFNRGARKFILTSRRGIRSSYQQYVIGLIRQRGAIVHVTTVDVASPDGMERLHRELIQPLGPLGGVFNLAVVLRDATIGNQTADSFRESYWCKAAAAARLDEFTRRQAPQLDYFVVFSSIVSSVGNGGQTNYGFANSVMERIVEQRRTDSLHGLAIEWGAVGGVGLLAGKTVSVVGTGPQHILSCLNTLDIFLREPSRAILSSARVLKKSAAVGSVGVENSSKLQQLLQVLDLESSSLIDEEKTLSELGMDSLVAAMLGFWIKSFNLQGKITKKLSELTLCELKSLVEESDDDDRGDVAPEYLPSLGSLMGKEVPRLVLKPFPLETPVLLKSKMTNEGILFLVHPMDGMKRCLEELASGMEHAVWALECTQDVSFTTVEELASLYVKGIKTIQPTGPYNLGGYSLGTVVVTEMAIQMENSGDSVDKVFLLDGSPRRFRNLLCELRASVYPENHEMGLLLIVIFAFEIEIEPEVIDIVVSSRNLEVAIYELVKRRNPGANLERLSETMVTVFNLLKAACNYMPNGRVEAQAVLLKATVDPYQVDGSLSKDYNLEEIYENVMRFEFDGDHHCFYTDPHKLLIPDMIDKTLGMQAHDTC